MRVPCSIASNRIKSFSTGRFCVALVLVAARFSHTGHTGQNGPAVRSSSTTYSTYSSSSRHCDVTVRPQLPDELPTRGPSHNPSVLWRDQSRIQHHFSGGLFKNHITPSLLDPPLGSIVLWLLPPGSRLFNSNSK